MILSFSQLEIHLYSQTLCSVRYIHSKKKKTGKEGMEKRKREMALSDIFHSDAQVIGSFIGLFLCCIIRKMSFLNYSTLTIQRVPSTVRANALKRPEKKLEYILVLKTIYKVYINICAIGENCSAI